MMARVGALVTLDLPADAPALALPWIITFGPLDDQDEEWEPVVCGPYERQHALALAEAVVADEELMAGGERMAGGGPSRPHVTVGAIRADILAARRAAESEDLETAELEADLDEYDDEPMVPSTPPSPDEIRAGFARIAGKLTS